MPGQPVSVDTFRAVVVTAPGDADVLRVELLQRAGDVFAAVADGSLHVAIGGRYALDDAAQAYRDLEGRATTGKLLFVPAHRA